MKNQIYVRRKLKILAPQGASSLDPKILGALQQNIARLGFKLSDEVLGCLSTYSLLEIGQFHAELVRTLRHMVGAHVKYKPMYPNFPEQVVNMSLDQLFAVNMVHYLGDWLGVRIMPDYHKRPRPLFWDKGRVKEIDLGTDEEFEGMVRDLLGARVAFSTADREDVTALVQHFADDIERFLPEELLNKENTAYIGAALLEKRPDAIDLLKPHIRTATDVLRLATALSKGDVSLAGNTKFINFSRPQRRTLLGLLEGIKNPAEDMQRFSKKWIRLGERVHPGEYKDRFPFTATEFFKLRNGIKYANFNSQVEAALVERNVDGLVGLLAKRPGDFARRLDHVLRISGDAESILSAFEEVAEHVSVNVLLQLHSHFKHRNEPSDLRVFFPKGQVAKAKAIANELEPMEVETLARVIQICEDALQLKFSDREKLGKVYVDPVLSKYTIPFSQRSASKSLQSLARGTRISFDDPKVLRFFMWWKEGKVGDANTGRVDIDLSAVVYDENWGYLEHVSYTNLKSARMKIFHSGDITSAPKGACEFVDVDLVECLRRKARYIVMSVNSYTEHPYCNLPECFAGWMHRKSAKSGEVFDARSVENKVDLGADTTISIPAIIDLYENEIIWTDLALKRNPAWYNNVEANAGGMTILGKAMSEMRLPNLYDLFAMHAEARGELVHTAEEADIVFSTDKGTTPFDSEDILANFL